MRWLTVFNHDSLLGFAEILGPNLQEVLTLGNPVQFELAAILSDRIVGIFGNYYVGLHPAVQVTAHADHIRLSEAQGDVVLQRTHRLVIVPIVLRISVNAVRDWIVASDIYVRSLHHEYVGSVGAIALVELGWRKRKCLPALNIVDPNHGIIYATVLHVQWGHFARFATNIGILCNLDFSGRR